MGAILIAFYTPWCPACKSLTPVFKRAANDLKKDHPNSKFGMVDVSANQELRFRFRIQSYPTLMWFFKDQPEREFTGKRDLESIKQYSIRMTQPESVVDKSFTCDQMLSTDWDSGSRNFRDVVFNGGQNHPEFKNFIHLAAEMENFNFVQALGCHEKF
jgi:hypothetical protein